MPVLERRVGRWFRVAIGVATIAASSRARAADLRTSEPPHDASSTLATESPDVAPSGRVNAGAWLGFETASVRLTHDGVTSDLVGRRVTLSPYVAIGLLDRLEFGLGITTALARAGSDTSSVPALSSDELAISSLTIAAKLLLAHPAADAFGGWSLAIAGAVDLPTATGGSDLSGDSVSGVARLIASYDYGRAISATASLGYRARGETVSLPSLTIGDAIPWGLTLTFRPQTIGLDDAGAWRWSLEARGSFGVRPATLLSDARLDPVFVGASARWLPASGIGAFFGVETSIVEAVGAPAWRGVVGLVFAPPVPASARDEDNDGVPDDRDECPGLAEDGLGPHPHDGCPDDSTATPAPSPTATPPAQP